jgi:hypothetical protein
MNLYGSILFTPDAQSLNVLDVVRIRCNKIQQGRQSTHRTTESFPTTAYICRLVPSRTPPRNQWTKTNGIYDEGATGNSIVGSRPLDRMNGERL